MVKLNRGSRLPLSLPVGVLVAAGSLVDSKNPAEGFLTALNIIDSIQLEHNNNELSHDSLTKLQTIFPENLIIAALDLIDRECVIHRTTPWNHTEYEVLGSTATYTVLLDLDAAPKVPFSCTCPSFIYAVLLSETHVMCKHLLATFLARKLSLCIERPTDLDRLSALYNSHFTLAETETELQ